MKHLIQPVSGSSSPCILYTDFSPDIDHGCSRVAHHFFNDPKAKFILTSKGEVLNANFQAANLLKAGILTRLPSGKINYGACDLNDGADHILNLMRMRRTSCERLLKRQPDEDWVVLEFSVAEFNKNKEVLLTVQQHSFCPESALAALSKTFDFTITESEVVRHISHALCPKEIGVNMDISTNTVRAHLRSIYSKTGARGYNRTLRLILQLLA